MTKQQQFQFCKICRLNQNQGKGHKYSLKHKKALSVLLSKFLKKVQDVLFFFRNPILLLPQFKDRNKFWCIACEQDIAESDSVFACNAIKHLASTEHRASVLNFWMENGADADKRDLYCISDQDFKKWEDRCLAVQSASEGSKGQSSVNDTNNIHYKDTCVNTVTKFHIPSFVDNLSDNVKPLQHHTGKTFKAERHENKALSAESVYFFHASHSINSNHGVHPSWCTIGKGLKENGSMSLTLENGKAPYGEDRATSEQKHGGSGFGYTTGASREGNNANVGLLNGKPVQYLASISSKLLSTEARSNIHSGATPPWLEICHNADGTSDKSDRLPKMPILSKTQEKKLKRPRNPKRVGAAWAERRRAELELEQRGESVCKALTDDPLWLPNFGRVWQSGSRRDSKKEFEAERKLKQSFSAINNDVAELQPYISKRMRMESRENASQPPEHVNDFSSDGCIS